MGTMRLLPILILFAMLTFFVRISDVASNMYSLNGKNLTAQATTVSALEPSAALVQIEPAAGKEDKNKDKSEEEMAEQDDTNKDSVQGEETTEEGSKWRDASDPEFEYANVKMEMFDDLSERRKNLEQKERALQTREALLRAGEQELNQKFTELTSLRTQIESLLQQQSEEEAARIKSLVTIYEGMKPKDAARIFDTLDLDVLVSVVSQMSERKLSPILAAMNAERARTITIMLAEQKKLPELPS